MAYNERKGGDTIDIKQSIDKAFEGVYIGFKGITTKIGPQKIYQFRATNGKGFEIYGFTMLNRVMDNVVSGEKCRITYLGTENVETKFGMKDVHQVRVEVDDEYTEEENEENVPF